jgi:hypothetical protein
MAGVRQLLDHAKGSMAGSGNDLKDKQVNAKVNYLLMKHRDGVFMPECTPKSFKMKAVRPWSSIILRFLTSFCSRRRKQHAQAEVGGVQQQAREGELLKTARRRQ